MRKLEGLIDCDGVWAQFAEQFLQEINAVTGSNWTIDHFRKWDIIGALNLDPADFDLVEERVRQPGWVRNLAPYEGARAGADLMRTLGPIHCLTLPFRHHPTWHPEREAWLEEHVGLGHSSVTHTGAKNRFRGDYLVDDKPEHVVAWQAAHPHGIAVLWDRCYNRDGFEKLPRAGNWEEAYATVLHHFGGV